MAQYCQHLNLPMTAEGFIEHLRTRLTEVAAAVDRTRESKHELMINERGEPVLKKLRAKAAPPGLAQLDEALREKIPERHLLDVLARIDQVTHYTHIEPLFGDQVVDWELVQTHWQDLLRVVAASSHSHRTQ